MENQHKENLNGNSDRFQTSNITDLPAGCFRMIIMIVLIIITGLYSISYGASDADNQQLDLPVTYALKMANDQEVNMFAGSVRDYIQMDEGAMPQYRLLNTGSSAIVSSGNDLEAGLTRLHVIDLLSGYYVLLLRFNEDYSNKNTAIKQAPCPGVESDNTIYGSYLTNTDQ